MRSSLRRVCCAFVHHETIGFRAYVRCLKMLRSIKSIVSGGILALASASLSYAADLSPSNWPKAERERLEKLERQTLSPLEAQSVEGDIPVLATGSVGMSLTPESIRVLLSLLGQHQALATVMAAPPLLGTFDLSGVDKAMSQQPVPIPQGAYGPDFIAKLKALGLNLTETPAVTVRIQRGTLAAVAINPRTGKRTAVNQPALMVFNGAE